MDYKEIIDKLVRELSYRVGVPNIHNKEHQSIMSEILSEWGEYEVKDTIFEFLAEKENKNDDRYVKKGRYFKLKGKESSEDPTYSKDEKGNYVKMDDKDSDTSSEDEEKAKDAVKKTVGAKSSYGKKQKELEKRVNDKKEKKGETSDDSEEETNVENPSFNTEKQKPQKGKLSDSDDEYSDGDIKQQGLEIGYKEKDGFKPAPGNAGSMLSEIMSGEVFSHLEENPNLTEDELFEKIHEQIEDTELGKQNGSKKKTKTGLLDATYRKNVRAIARAGITKYKENQKGIDRLESEGKMIKPVKVRNFYDHEKSISQQVKLIESINGPIYTKEGVEVPKEVVVDLIKKSGGGENPSDTSTITIDKDGRALVTFHSDKLSTADIQANSTPNKESEQAKELVEKSSLTDIEKADVINTIENGQTKLEEKEQQLKSAANQPAREMSEGDISKILEDIKSDKGIDSKAKVSSHLNKSLISRGKPHPNIEKYLPEKDGDYSEEELLKAFYDYMGDDDKESEPTASQLKLLYRSAKQNGYDISSTLGRIREESLQVQRDTHKKLNEKFIVLPNGKQVPMGDYIEGQNLVEKLHLNVMDGEKNEGGVGKYPGLFNLNMGGTLVEGDELKKCIDVDGTDDFIENFEVGTPGDGEEVTKNKETGQVTGRNIFVFAVTKGGKRIKVAFKTQRSKQGESGKLSTTYQWDKGIQDCFKS